MACSESVRKPLLPSVRAEQAADQAQQKAEQQSRQNAEEEGAAGADELRRFIGKPVINIVVSEFDPVHMDQEPLIGKAVDPEKQRPQHVLSAGIEQHHRRRIADQRRDVVEGLEVSPQLHHQGRQRQAADRRRKQQPRRQVQAVMAHQIVRHRHRYFC